MATFNPPEQYAMHIRCPHCQNPMELLDDVALKDISCSSCGSNFSLANESTATDRSVTRRIAHFELVEQVGLGGFGSVWKALDSQLDRTVAVKLPRKDQLAPDEQEQFLREARAAAQLHHPSIVSIYEVGREGEAIYIVSDFVQGATLAEWLESQQMTPNEAVKLLIAVCEAVHHAHERGVIHRDLKPGNILMDLEGRPHVTDFGLAKREQGEITMTVEGRILGTPAFMSPEQARGEGHHADRRSDIYSLGVILFQLLTGELPFRGSPRMLVVQILKDEPPSPRRLNHSVSRDLETICLKCLQKDPARRYATAQDLADDLKRILTREPILARPISRIERGWRWCKRNQTLSAALGAAFVCLVLGATISTYFAVAANRSADSAESRRMDAVQATNAAKSANRLLVDANRKTQTMLLDSIASSGLFAAQNGDWSDAALFFANAAVLAGDDSGRRLANRVRTESYLRRAFIPINAVRLPMLTQIAGITSNRNYVVGQFAGQVLLADLVTGGDPLQLNESPVSAIAMSEGGERVAFAQDGNVLVLSVPDLKHREVIPCDSLVSALGFSKDGGSIAIAGTRLQIWNRASAAFAGDGVDLPFLAINVAFNSRGTLLAVSCQDEQAHLFGIAEDSSVSALPHKFAHRFPEYGALPAVPAFLGQDDVIVTAATATSVALWDTAHGAKLADADSYLHGIECIARSDDGRAVAVSGFPGATVFDDKLQPLRPFLRHRNGVECCAFSPDGNRIVTVSGDRTAKLWSVRQVGRGHTIEHQDGSRFVTFGKSNDSFVTVEDAGVARRWRIPKQTSENAQVAMANNRRVLRLPDGAHVAIAQPVDDGEFVLALCRAQDLGPVGPRFHGKGYVHCAASSNGKRIAILTAANSPETGEPVGTIHIWNVASGETERTISLAEAPIAIGYAPNSEVVIALSDQGQVAFVRADTGALQASPRHLSGVRVMGHDATSEFIEFSPDGESVATCGVGPNVCIWSVKSGDLISTVVHQSFCFCARFSNNGRFVVSTDSDGAVFVSRANDATIVSRLSHADWVFSARFSDDDSRIVTGCRDKRARIWDWKSEKLACPPLSNSDETTDACFFANDQWVCTADRYGQFRVWEAATGKPVSEAFDAGEPLWRIELAAQAKRALVSAAAPRLYSFDLSYLDTPRTGSLSDDELRQFAELVSGKTFYDFTGLANMDSDEWWQRWQELGRESPRVIASLPGVWAENSESGQIQAEVAGHGASDDDSMAALAAANRITALRAKAQELIADGMLANAIAALEEMNQCAVALAAGSSIPQHLYNQACATSLLANAIAISGDAERAEKLRGKALAALREAMKRGATTIEHMQADSDLDAIRQHRGYIELVDGLPMKAEAEALIDGAATSNSP